MALKEPLELITSIIHKLKCPQIDLNIIGCNGRGANDVQIMHVCRVHITLKQNTITIKNVSPF